MFLEHPTVDAVVRTARDLRRKNDDCMCVLLGEKSAPIVRKMIQELNRHEVPFFGGIFPGVVSGDRRFDGGAVIKVLPSHAETLLFRNLAAVHEQADVLKRIRSSLDGEYTALVLVDGLAANISLFLQDLFHSLGTGVNYLGGGAGSLSLLQRPCVFMNDGLFQNAAIAAFIRLRCSLGVRHGWEPCAGPFVATKTSHNIITELNWEPAFGVYQQAVANVSGRKLTRKNFFALAKAYPFGMLKEGAEYVVRDPIAVNDRSEFVCVGEIPENAVLTMLQGAKTKLLAASGRAADDCLNNIHGKDVQAALLFDAVSRALYLEDFSAELRVIRSRLAAALRRRALAGALTLGEISSCGRKYLEFLNKTVVLGVLYR